MLCIIPCQLNTTQQMNNRLNFKQMMSRFVPHQSCILCASTNGGQLGLCQPCAYDLPWPTGGHCPQCGLPNGEISNTVICGRCLQNPPHFSATAFCFHYAFPIDAVIQAYKYQHRLALANFFADLLLQQLSKSVSLKANIDLIIPMPMHTERIKARGFNQALEIARILAKSLAIPLDYTSCIRTKNNPPQASLALTDRVKNMRGVFACQQRFSGKTIVIVDDVMTTSASMNALAKTLKQAGADAVICWVIARTLPSA